MATITKAAILNRFEVRPTAQSEWHILILVAFFFGAHFFVARRIGENSMSEHKRQFEVERASVDPEADGQPTAAADGDDLNNLDDEDDPRDVILPTPLPVPNISPNHVHGVAPS